LTVGSKEEQLADEVFNGLKSLRLENLKQTDPLRRRQSSAGAYGKKQRAQSTLVNRSFSEGGVHRAGTSRRVAQIINAEFCR